MYEEEQKNIRLGVALNAFFAVAELAAGVIANSLALISDALHDFSDTSALLLSWWAAKKAGQAPDAKKTFGYHRALVLSALLNGVILTIITLAISQQAYNRLFSPQVVEGKIMVVVAVFGILVNGYVAFKTNKGPKHVHTKSVTWHFLEDALGWLGVLSAGILINATGWLAADSLATFLVGLLVLSGVWGVMSETTNILMEATPPHLKLEEIKKKVSEIAGVQDVHDLHVWTIGPNYYAASLHVKVGKVSLDQACCTTAEVKKVLEKNFGITHVTVETENEKCEGKICL